MRYSHACPKCEHTDILRIPGTKGAYGVGNNIPLPGGLMLHAVLVTRYACTNCGFTEEWIDDAQDMKRLIDRYGQAPPPQS